MEQPKYLDVMVGDEPIRLCLREDDDSTWIEAFEGVLDPFGNLSYQSLGHFEGIEGFVAVMRAIIVGAAAGSPREEGGKKRRAKRILTKAAKVAAVVALRNNQPILDVARALYGDELREGDAVEHRLRKVLKKELKDDA